jgi:hypothetical protein
VSNASQGVTVRIGKFDLRCGAIDRKELAFAATVCDRLGPSFTEQPFREYIATCVDALGVVFCAARKANPELSFADLYDEATPQEVVRAFKTLVEVTLQIETEKTEMSIIKAKINGIDYGFAPLKLGELRGMRQMKESSDGSERLDEWMPLLASSVERGQSGILCGALPDFDDMDVDKFNFVFTEMIRCVMAASGVKLGEAQPATESLSSGAHSTASSSPQPAGESAK